MCGVPVHAAEAYLEKLIRKGFRVAVCEQVEDPAEARKRGAKSVVKREVIRLVTPGTLTEDSLLEARRPISWPALGRAGGDFALASADMSAGEFRVRPVAPADLGGELARLSPSEVLAPDALLADATVGAGVEGTGPALTPLPAIKFDSAARRARAQGALSRRRAGRLRPVQPRRTCRRRARWSPISNSPRRESFRSLQAAGARPANAPSWRSTRRRGAISN